MRSQEAAAVPTASLVPFARLCIVTCVVIFGLIVVGGIVRATHSGLGCPDWPTCHGNIIPTTDKHTLIEYSHRLTASIAGLLVLSIAVWAWRSFRRVPAIFYPSVLSFVLVLAQAGLGGAVVENELPAGIVVVHLAMALTILTLLVLLTTTAISMTRTLAPANTSRSLSRMALLASAGTLALMLVGSYVAGAGYGLACSGWPLCNGDVIPNAGGASVQVHFAHRFLAALVGLIVLGLVWQAWRERDKAPIVFALALAALGVFCVQAMIGAANIWTELADEVTALHLATASLMWTVLALLDIRVFRLYELLPRSVKATPRADLAHGVTR
jgi:heme A synthase